MLNNVDQAFHDVLSRLLASDRKRLDRTGVGTIGEIGNYMRFDCSEGRIPVPSSRFIPTKAFRHEMLWFISGTSSIKYLRDKKVGVWDSWFIKGSDKYDEPKVTPLDGQRRIDLAIEAGHYEAIIKFFDDFIETSGVIGNLHYRVDHPNNRSGRLYKNLPAYFGKELFKKLGELGVPENLSIGGGKRISLKRRLARLSKDRAEPWVRINEIVANGPIGEDIIDARTGIVIFRNGKFEATAVNPGQVDAIDRVLDTYNVSAYELLDADIGSGGYGPNWRKWQDTQLVEGLHDGKEVKAYKEQGYEWKGALWDDIATQIMHREIDQLQNVIKQLQTNPDDRRMIVCAWNPARTWQAALPPCHLYFQFVTWELSLDERNALHDKMHDAEQLAIHQRASANPEEPLLNMYTNLVKMLRTADMSDEEWHSHLTNRGVPSRRVSLALVLRSSDAPLGLVFNTAQYAYLLHMVAHVVNMVPDELVVFGVDTHVYTNQVEKVREWLDRESHPDSDPRIVFNRKVENIDDFTFEDIDIVNYHSQEKIEIPVAV